MKLKPIQILTLVLGFSIMFSCIDSEATDEVIFVKDQEAIDEYIASANLVNVKEVKDPVSGITIIWQELSDSGITISNGDTASVNYTGRLLNDRIFDTSIESVARANNLYTESRKYSPLKFRLGIALLIPGFEFGVLQLQKGDKATVFIPSLFGYGNQANGNIPANSPLIFEMELVEVKDGPTL